MAKAIFAQTKTHSHPPWPDLIQPSTNKLKLFVDPQVKPVGGENRGRFDLKELRSNLLSPKARPAESG